MKRVDILLAVVVLAFCLTGCATQKNNDLENQKLRNQITALNAQIQTNQAQTETTVAPQIKPVEAIKVETEVKYPPATKQIQTALANAGYDPGKVDGKMGEKTKKAIRRFQKDHKLQVDGKVDRKTWNVLKEYLSPEKYK